MDVLNARIVQIFSQIDKNYVRYKVELYTLDRFSVSIKRV
jgi:hypothetical protein